MDADLVTLMLAQLRADLPGVGDDYWARIESILRKEHGGRDHFVARRAKRDRIAELEAAIEANAEADNAALSRLMGLSVRRVQQLRRLCK